MVGLSAATRQEPCVVEDDHAERAALSSVANGDPARALDVLGPEADGVQRVLPPGA
jgi:hypothetical protein